MIDVRYGMWSSQYSRASDKGREGRTANHRELTTLSKRTSDSFIRFCPFSSSSTWSYSESATQKMIDVTASKQWILQDGTDE